MSFRNPSSNRLNLRAPSLKTWVLSLLTLGSGMAHAGYLFTGIDPDTHREEFILPNVANLDTHRFSEWDNFYSKHTYGNLPDYYAPHGGVKIGGAWYPTERPVDFPYRDTYNSLSPNAFWDSANATITQVGTTDASITTTGNIYSHTETMSFRLDDDTSNGTFPITIGTVIFQFETDGTLTDFSSIRLAYEMDGVEHFIYASDLNRAEYLREFKSASGENDHWAAGNGYTNRVAVQWDLSNITDLSGMGIQKYRIEWSSETTYLTFRRAALDVSEEYTSAIPASRTWSGGSGSWGNEDNWFRSGQYGGAGSGPEENGNVRFGNSEEATVDLTSDHTAGEIIFDSAHDVTISTSNGASVTANTGISTTASATGLYSVNTNYKLGALNFFDINGGSVVMNGVISGDYGIVKTGSGSLTLANNNTFKGFIGLDEGTLRIEGTNVYTGDTTVLNGRLVLAADALVGSGALGVATTAVRVGADAGVNQNERDWLAELFIEGNHRLNREISLAPGDYAKRLGGIETGEHGAIFGGAIRFSAASSNPAETSIAGNVSITAQSASDRVIFEGEMTGGGAAKTVTLDGAGVVEYSKVVKSYNNSTKIASGTLLLANDSGYNGAGNVTVQNGAQLTVDGTLGGSGSLILESGARIGGSGTINRSFTVGNGVVLSPGNSPGTLTTADQTWASGGTVIWELADAEGVAGEDWDLLDIQGSLNLTATTESKFILSIRSLTSSNEAGAASNFDPTESYRWMIAKTSSTIQWDSASGEDFSSFFQLDSSLFAGIDQGLFNLDLVNLEGGGSELYLSYAIPEPSTWALTVMAGALGLYARRRARC